MNVLANLKISTKILASMSLLALLCMGLVGFSAYELNALGKQAHSLVHVLAESQRLTAGANDSMNMINSLNYQLVASSNLTELPRIVKAIDVEKANLVERSAKLRDLLDGDRRVKWLAIEQGVAEYLAISDKVYPLAAAGKRAAAEVAIDTAAPVYERLEQMSDAAITKIAADMTEGAAEIDRAQSRGVIALAVAAVSGIVCVGGVVLLVVRRQISGPLQRIGSAMSLIAGGDNSIDVPGSDRGDEIGTMAKALLIFREAAVGKAAADAEKADADATMRMVVETLAASLAELSNRDLGTRVTVDYPGRYAVLKDNYNEAIANVQATIGQVSESATNIRTGSAEIAQASEDLARRTEGNAASLEETSAALVQIDTRLKATAQASGQTVMCADQAIAAVGGGRKTADQAVQAMGRVSDSAKGIDSVIEGLDKIAFQTRVLAMNAAVEAGRAGDAGRGFAVVADLVSALAMRAEEEAKRARDQLTLTQTDIVTAVQAVEKVDGALVQISSDVGQVHLLLGKMADDAAAQSSAVSQITAAISAMDQSTQQNAAMVEETSAAARNLTTEVTSLAEQAAMFTIADAVSVKRRKSVPVARGDMPNAKATSLAREVVAPRTGLVGAGATAREDWNSF